MAKRQQAWVGIVVGSVSLLALFAMLYALSGGGYIALDGDRFNTAAQGETGADDRAALGDVEMSGTDGDVSSFGSDGTGSFSDGNGTGVALRVVTDEGTPTTVASDPATTSVSSSTSASFGATASETSPTTAAIASSSAVPATTAKATSTTERRTSTTKAPTSSSSTMPSTASTATTAAPTSAPPTTGSDSGSTARNFEQEVIRLTNEERSAGGCGPLTNNAKLHSAALGHSVDMAENDYFSHTSQDGSSMVDRVERQGYGWRSLAENIAAGHRSPSAVVDGWMNSSGHRANILNCDLTEIGVGFHSYYWTQNFGTPR